MTGKKIICPECSSSIRVEWRAAKWSWADLVHCFSGWISLRSFSGSVAYGHFPLEAKNPKDQEKKQVQQYTDLMGSPGSKEQKARDIFELAQQVSVEEVPMLFLVCGGKDGSVKENHAFLAVLAKRRIPYEHRKLSPRGHG